MSIVTFSTYPRTTATPINYKNNFKKPLLFKLFLYHGEILGLARMS